MFLLLFAATTALLLFYVAWHVGSLPWISRRAGQRTRRLITFLLLLTGTTGVALHHAASGLAWLMGEWSVHLLAVLFLTALCLLAVDLVTLFGVLQRRRLDLWRAGARGGAGLLTGAALVQGLRAPVVSSFEVRLPRLPTALDGKVVVALSDLHLGAQRGPAWLAARVAQTEALAPDLVLLLGDNMEGYDVENPELFLPALQSLHAPLGVWAVAGNHESFGNGARTEALFTAAGVQWLHNTTATIAPGLVLAGVDDFDLHLGRRQSHAFALGARIDRQQATILLSHAPVAVEEAAAAGVGLMLSGHTHAGQIWPFGYLVEQFYPRLEGRFTAGDMTLIVSRGAGTWGPRMRLWKPGELVRVILRAG